MKLLFGTIVPLAYIVLVLSLMYTGFSRERKKAAALRARAKAQREGMDKICDASKKLHDLMEENGPLYPHDKEVQAAFRQIAEGEK